MGGQQCQQVGMSNNYEERFDHNLMKMNRNLVLSEATLGTPPTIEIRSRRRRMTMLLMMFLTQWLWQVASVSSAEWSLGRATVQNLDKSVFSTTGVCTEIS